MDSFRAAVQAAMAGEGAPETPDKPWYAEVQAWVREMGISDGTRPLESCTRAEEWTIAYRLYQAVKAGK